MHVIHLKIQVTKHNLCRSTWGRFVVQGQHIHIAFGVELKFIAVEGQVKEMQTNLIALFLAYKSVCLLKLKEIRLD